MPSSCPVNRWNLFNNRLPISQQFIITNFIFPIDPSYMYAGLIFFCQKVDVESFIFRENDMSCLFCVKFRFNFRILFCCFSDLFRFPGSNHIF